MKLACRGIAAVVGLVLLGIGAGCSSHGGSLQVQPQDGRPAVVQEFNQAYIGLGQSGDYEIVLLDNAADWNVRAPRKGKPIQPASLEPVRQVMHIRMFWRPISGTTNNPAAINSSIEWHVFGSEESDDVIVYEGAGYVVVDGSGPRMTVDIRDGQLAPKSQSGRLQDPIGRAHISGEFSAIHNEGHVQDTVAELAGGREPSAAIRTP